MKKLKERNIHLQGGYFFRAASSSVAAIGLNHSASPVQEVSPMGLLGANSGYSNVYILAFMSV